MGRIGRLVDVECFFYCDVGVNSYDRDGLLHDESSGLSGCAVGVHYDDSLHSCDRLVGASVCDSEFLSSCSVAREGLVLANKCVMDIGHGVLDPIEGFSWCSSANSHSTVL